MSAFTCQSCGKHLGLRAYAWGGLCNRCFDRSAVLILLACAGLFVVLTLVATCGGAQ